MHDTGKMKRRLFEALHKCINSDQSRCWIAQCNWNMAGKIEKEKYYTDRVRKFRGTRNKPRK